MARLHVYEPSEAQRVVDELHNSLGRRMSVSSLAPCPVEFTAAFVGMCATQSCGKCTPCRVGLVQLQKLIERVLSDEAIPGILPLIERTANDIYQSADCAIGYEAAAMTLRAVRGFHDDFEYHIAHQGNCGFEESREVPCVSGCPAGVDVPGYLALIAEGRNTDAVKLIRKDNPLTAVCGYVCEHPCEIHCRRGMVDDPINIRGLKRYAFDHMEKDYSPSKAPSTGKRIAVIGGGPAGLSAAYYLMRMGHTPIIFEQRHALGGMLRYGIPAYRLPREILDTEIEWLCREGIERQIDTSVGTDISMDDLKTNYDAVYLAIGAHSDRKLGLEGEEAAGVISAVSLLRACGDNDNPDFTGEDVTVIGGGNVAMDVARTAARCHAKSVTVVYRRRVADMSAQDEEIEGALAEGIEMLELHAPVKIETENGQVAGLRVARQIIGEVIGGRPKPRVADTEEFVVPCSRVLVAVGQVIDSSHFGEVGIPLNRGKIIANTFGRVPGEGNLFAGGDAVSGPATVILSVEAGKVAASNIDKYLGYNHEIEADVEIPEVKFTSTASCARTNLVGRPAKERKGDFDLFEWGLTPQEALQEAGRCLRCDHFGFGAFRGGRSTKW